MAVTASWACPTRTLRLSSSVSSEVIYPGPDMARKQKMKSHHHPYNLNMPTSIRQRDLLHRHSYDFEEDNQDRLSHIYRWEYGYLRNKNDSPAFKVGVGSRDDRSGNSKGEGKVMSYGCILSSENCVQCAIKYGQNRPQPTTPQNLLGWNITTS